MSGWLVVMHTYVYYFLLSLPTPPPSSVDSVQDPVSAVTTFDVFAAIALLIVTFLPSGGVSE